MSERQEPYLIRGVNEFSPLVSPQKRVTIEVTPREAALIRRVRELASRYRELFVIEITEAGFVWREVGKREGK